MRDDSSPLDHGMDRPLISVVVACLNAGSTIRKCLQSVFAQKTGLAEIVVIDGGSTDGTVQILEELQPHLSYWVTEPDPGIYAAWNKALGHVRGAWTLFLGADDTLWSNDALEKMEPWLRARGDHPIVYGKVALLDEDNRLLTFVGRSWPEVREPFFAGRCISNPGVFYRSSLFTTEHFDPSFRITGDYDFLMRVLSRSDPCFAHDVVVAGFRAGGASSNPSHLFSVIREIDRVLLKNGHPRSTLRRTVHRGQAIAWMTLMFASRVLTRDTRKRLLRVLLLRSARGA